MGSPDPAIDRTEVFLSLALDHRTPGLEGTQKVPRAQCLYLPEEESKGPKEAATLLKSQNEVVTRPRLEICHAEHHHTLSPHWVHTGGI